MRILIVDDDPDIRRLLAFSLKAAGYDDLLTGACAADAFTLLGIEGAAPADPLPDLILTDITMPGTDGIEECARIKSTPGLEDLPIIMVSALGDTQHLTRAFDAGAMDYITKPLNRAEMLVRVRSALRLKAEIDRRKAREQELLRVTEQLEAANRTLAYLSMHDGLTNVANRRRFDLALDEEWARADRQNTPLALVLIDIDAFKRYNDRYGHQYGDACLQRVAGALRGTVRHPEDLVARYGGEEFVILLPGAEAGDALRVAERARRSVAGLGIPHEASPVAPHVTISAGVACCDRQTITTPRELVAAADSALYQAKNSGRDRVMAAGRGHLPDPNAAGRLQEGTDERADRGGG